MSGEIQKEGKLIGKITHYFSKAEVAIMNLSDNLKIGDTIRIIGSTVAFTQEIDSTERDHQKIIIAKKGDVVGIKVNKKVKEENKVYKL